MSDLLRVVNAPAPARATNDTRSQTCARNEAPLAVRDEAWLRAAQRARWLAWASLVWMTMEGAVGLYAGLAAASIALIGWALGSAIEGFASIIVVWRFSGSRTLSETAERAAQRAVAISFWLLAPFIAFQSVRNLASGHHPESSIIGIALTASSVVLMPVLGRAKQHLAKTLDSRATAKEGTQNYICAAQAAAVLAGLTITALRAGGWWFDAVIGLAIAAWSVWEGRKVWNGEDCC